jgi:hypothetical protein
MMSVNSLQCWTPLLSVFLNGKNASCMRIRGMMGSQLSGRSRPTDTFHGLHERSAHAAVLRRTVGGLWRRPTPGSTGSANCWSGMRSWLKATRPLFILLRRSFVGERLLLFTDKFLVRDPHTIKEPCRSLCDDVVEGNRRLRKDDRQKKSIEKVKR